MNSDNEEDNDDETELTEEQLQILEEYQKKIKELVDLEERLNMNND